MDESESTKNRNDIRPEHNIDDQNKAVAIAEREIELLNPQNEVVGRSRISFISPSVNNETQSVLVKSLYENSNGQLRSDQFSRVRVIWDRRPGVLVPTTAITRVAGQDFVFIAETNKQSQKVARQRPVKLGEIQGNSYQVIEGLKAGEEIVISGI